MIKAVIFDCFGVLVGSGFWNVYEELGGDLARDGEFVDTQLNKLSSGKMPSQQFSIIMADRLGVSLSEYQAALRQDERPNEAVFDFIQHELKPKLKLALLSNATGESVRQKIPQNKLAIFDELILSGEVGLLKPSSEIFRLALTRLGVSADEAVFIDDHQPYVDAASKLGIRSILFKGLNDLKSQLKLM